MQVYLGGNLFCRISAQNIFSVYLQTKGSKTSFGCCLWVLTFPHFLMLNGEMSNFFLTSYLDTNTFSFKQLATSVYLFIHDSLQIIISLLSFLLYAIQTPTPGSQKNPRNGKACWECSCGMQFYSWPSISPFDWRSEAGISIPNKVSTHLNQVSPDHVWTFFLSKAEAAMGYLNYHHCI